MLLLFSLSDDDPDSEVSEEKDFHVVVVVGERRSERDWKSD